MSKSKSVRIKTGSSYVSGIFETTKTAKAGLTLAHGFAVLRFQFPYMEAGKKRPDSPKVATATVAAAVAALRKRVPGLSLFGTGKSFAPQPYQTINRDIA